MRGSDSSDIKYNNRPQSLNGFEEMVEFLPATNSKKVEKMAPKTKLLIAGLVVGAFLLSLTVGLLVWHFAYRSAPVQKVYSGYLRVTNYPFVEAYENPSSPEFADLSSKVVEMLQKTYQSNRAIGPHFVQCNVTAFSEGSVISYYWSEFSVPKYLEADLDAAMSELKVQTVTLRQRISLSVDSFVAYPTDPLMARNFRNNKCTFFLHATPGSVTKFSSPGFPDASYPPNSRCQWELRADAGHMILLHFKTFKMESCKVSNGDYVSIYDSLTAVEPRIMTKLCGSYPPSYNLTFISSQNVMLVTLVSDDKEKHPGFKAEFIQIQKTTLCGGTIRDASGQISTPFFPAHYPPNRECEWDIQVPEGQFVKIRFQLFYLYEPGVSITSCPKDYVEVNNQRYCGERSPFVVSNNSSKITVKFRSDQSNTDTGFTAQYLSYEPKNPCPDQFTCKSGRCIDKTRKCDGWNDCGDNSDEVSCACTDKQFRCKTSQYCKPRFFVCDGVNDCGDSSDEQDCKCSAQYLKCRNGKCIPEAQKCDNTDNCGDGTDESDCGLAQPTSCTTFTYKCKDGQCINKLNPECDSVSDCTDGSDEALCQCGKRPYSKKTRIVGGVNADIGEFPWQVSLQTNKDGHACGASVVSQTILLSAAHCFQDTSTLRYSDPSVWTAYMGLHDQSTKTSSNDVVKRKIKRIVAHRMFSDITYDNDIAMLELDSPITFTDFIQPICIPESTHVFPVGKSIWVTGWGALSEGGTGAAVLQKAEIRIINQTECNKLLDGQLTPRMICAGYLSGGIDACQGDSGGPLSSVELNGKIYLAGIVSWGDGCARRNKPGIYTKVTEMRDWITQNAKL
ncbi:suppressor of tumorigenicity 14 protein [Rana temporaria]|uniref:suppressor of tumorigenicity 14 protein n=1 Tax=Rana temporaria TaxID=8407 RepID=UPI001AAD578D|nr:suppressor of tumorigenicity 14 protein [Rana temporaria]